MIDSTMKVLGLLILLISSLGIQSSCVKEVEKIITVRDTIIVLKKDTVILQNFIKDSSTSFILCRHAETGGPGSNPNLSTIGMERATELARILKPTIIDQIYTSNFNRTTQTANTVAMNYNLNPLIYDPSNQKLWINDLLIKNKNKKILIVGHSNTIPELLNLLSGTNNYNLIPDTEYNNLYLVTLPETGRASIVHMKYGK